MQQERWLQIQDLFEAAADLDAPAAEAYLKTHCPDTGMRREVQALITNTTRAEAFFSKPSIELQDDSGEPHPDERIGPYRVVRRIGRGGMGSVFLAVRADGEFHKHVAVKVIRSGLATPALLRQFKAERQMLARLDHPNIARLLDAGVTASGLPYVMMEYVEGSILTCWCDERRSSIDQRLRLFQQVCAAVHHAHQHLVVHGDIKPGNIFVTADGAPKLLDFGVGKLLEDAEPGSTRAPTGMMPRLMTPEYASPEQLRGEGVTTSSDVYSLGVLLVELLSGSLPVSPGRLLCRAQEITPEAAAQRATSQSKLRSLLRGDLDTIVGAALHETPARRYASAERFSDDIQRHLSGLPVAARPDSWTYRAGKYVRRHKLGVAATTAVILALATTAAVARKQQIDTTRRLKEITALSLANQTDFSDLVLDSPGTIEARIKTARRHLDHLEGILREAPGDADVQHTVAYFYRRFALMNYGRNSQHIGDSGTALVYARKALEGYEQIEAAQQRRAMKTDFSPHLVEVAETPGQILHIYAQLGDLLIWTRRDFQGAAELHQKEERVIRRMSGGKEGVSREADWQMAHLQLRRAREALMQDQPMESLKLVEEGVGRLRRMTQRYPPDEDYTLYQAFAYVTGANADLALGESRRAVETLERARPEIAKAIDRHPAWISPQIHWIRWQQVMALAQARSGNCRGAIGTSDNALERARNLVRLDPVNKSAEETLADTLLSVGQAFNECRNPRAPANLAWAVEAWDALIKLDPQNVQWRHQLDLAQTMAAAAR